MAKTGPKGPTKMTPEVLRKLEEAFLIGCPDRTACIYAGIGERTLYDHCKKNPEFSQRKELLKEMPKYKALKTVEREIQLDGNLAFKYLERKMKDEFGPQTKHDVNLANQPDEKFEVIFVNDKGDVSTKT